MTDCKANLTHSISNNTQKQFNPNPIGIYGGLEFIGGGGPLWPPPQISAMNAPIDAKIGTDVEHVIKNEN